MSPQLDGAKDAPLLQRLKGGLREFEADLLWAYHGFGRNEVYSRPNTRPISISADLG